MRRKTFLKLGAALMVLGLVAAACGNDGNESTAADDTPASAVEGATTLTEASTLRAELTGLLTEHVYLAALSTDAALRGDTPAFEAYAAALNGTTDSNTSDLVAVMTSAYGDEVGAAFDGLWRSDVHIGAFVAYTQAVAADDQVAADKAVADLLAYAKTFATTMNSVNSNLPADAVEEAIVVHATTLKAVIDAQKAGNPVLVAKLLREAVHHMSGTADLLAEGTVKQFPEKF